jgi:hypothetical protein
MTSSVGTPRVAACFFFHWNILYAEISQTERRELPARSYAPILDLLADHPRITAAVEMNGATLEHLQSRHPTIIDKLKRLADANQIELVGSTWRSPFLLDVRGEHFARHMRMYLKLHKQVFESHPQGFYAHECCADGRLPRLMREYAYGWFFAWTRHIARHLSERDRPNYVAHGFVHPYAFTSDDGERMLGLPLHGDEIDCMLSASDGVRALDWYADHLGSFADVCAGRPGILVPGPSDGEFIHDGEKTPAWFRRVFETHRHIRPAWIDRLWRILETDARLDFTLPSAYFAANPTAESLALLPGGGFEREDLEHSEVLAEPLQKQLRKLAAQVDLLEAKLRFAVAEGKKVGHIGGEIESHTEKMLALELSDLSRWHPSAGKRKESVDAARQLLARGREIEQELDSLGSAPAALSG